MTGFDRLIRDLQARRWLSEADQVELRALRTRQARLTGWLGEARQRVAALEADRARRRAALAAEIIRLGRPEPARANVKSR